MSAFDKEISFGKGGRYPDKRSVNLYIQENHTKENVIALILFGIYLVGLAFFAKYGVIDQIAKINRYETNYNNTEQLLTTMQEQNSDYDAVLAEYSHYGNGYLSDDEKTLQDREDILNVLEKELISNGALQNVSITGNTASLTFDSGKLKNVSELIQQIDTYDIVSYASVSTSSTTGQQVQTADGQTQNTQGQVSTTMTIVFNDVDTSEDSAAGDTTADTAADGTADEAGTDTASDTVSTEEAAE